LINNKQECTKAIDLALSGKWDEAHTIVQEINTDFAQWIHAVLHKMKEMFIIVGIGTVAQA